MNTPPYILVDEFAAIVTATKVALGLPNINYMYGYLSEVRENLAQATTAGGNFATTKFPLVWLVQPFTIERGENGMFGDTRVNVLIITGSDINWKAKQRMDNNYKPIIYPIYEELLNQINIASDVFEGVTIREHSFTDRYYWGGGDKVIDDIFDCSEISGLTLRIQDKQNCTITKNL